MKDNRQAFRFVSDEAVLGELILANGRRWPICIADQSASGFGVLTDSLPPTKCGDLAELRTDSFVCEVRVVHMTKNEGAASRGIESEPVAKYRLGLVRLRDISIKSVELTPGKRHTHWQRLVPDRIQNPIALFAVVFGAVIAGGTVIGLLSSANSPERSGANARSDQVASTGESLHQRNPSAAHPERNFKLDSRPIELRRLPGALPFVMTGVVRELDLTDEQIDRMHRIVDDTNAAIAQNEEMRQLLESARSEAVGVLTVEQRRQWASLSGANTSAIVRRATLH
jgi:hypothetical protein